MNNDNLKSMTVEERLKALQNAAKIEQPLTTNNPITTETSNMSVEDRLSYLKQQEKTPVVEDTPAIDFTKMSPEQVLAQENKTVAEIEKQNNLEAGSLAKKIEDSKSSGFTGYLQAAGTGALDVLRDDIPSLVARATGNLEEIRKQDDEKKIREQSIFQDEFRKSTGYNIARGVGQVGAGLGLAIPAAIGASALAGGGIAGAAAGGLAATAASTPLSTSQQLNESQLARAREIIQSGATDNIDEAMILAQKEMDANNVGRNALLKNLAIDSVANIASLGVGGLATKGVLQSSTPVKAALRGAGAGAVVDAPFNYASGVVGANINNQIVQDKANKKDATEEGLISLATGAALGTGLGVVGARSEVSAARKAMDNIRNANIQDNENIAIRSDMLSSKLADKRLDFLSKNNETSNITFEKVSAISPDNQPIPGKYVIIEREKLSNADISNNPDVLTRENTQPEIVNQANNVDTTPNVNRVVSTTEPNVNLEPNRVLTDNEITDLWLNNSVNNGSNNVRELDLESLADFKRNVRNQEAELARQQEIQASRNTNTPNLEQTPSYTSPNIRNSENVTNSIPSYSKVNSDNITRVNRDGGDTFANPGSKIQDIDNGNNKIIEAVTVNNTRETIKGKVNPSIENSLPIINKKARETTEFITKDGSISKSKTISKKPVFEVNSDNSISVRGITSVANVGENPINPRYLNSDSKFYIAEVDNPSLKNKTTDKAYAIYTDTDEGVLKVGSLSKEWAEVVNNRFDSIKSIEVQPMVEAVPYSKKSLDNQEFAINNGSEIARPVMDIKIDFNDNVRLNNERRSGDTENIKQVEEFWRDGDRVISNLNPEMATKLNDINSNRVVNQETPNVVDTNTPKTDENINTNTIDTSNEVDTNTSKVESVKQEEKPLTNREVKEMESKDIIDEISKGDYKNVDMLKEILNKDFSKLQGVERSNIDVNFYHKGAEETPLIKELLKEKDAEGVISIDNEGNFKVALNIDNIRKNIADENHISNGMSFNDAFNYVYAHEVYGHGVMRSYFKEEAELNRFFDSVYKNNPLLKDLVDLKKKMYNQHYTSIEEVLADIGTGKILLPGNSKYDKPVLMNIEDFIKGHELGNNPGAIKKLMQAFKDVINKISSSMGVGKVFRTSKSDIEDINTLLNQFKSIRDGLFKGDKELRKFQESTSTVRYSLFKKMSNDEIGNSAYEANKVKENVAFLNSGMITTAGNKLSKVGGSLLSPEFKAKNNVEYNRTYSKISDIQDNTNYIANTYNRRLDNVLDTLTQSNGKTRDKHKIDVLNKALKVMLKSENPISSPLTKEQLKKELNIDISDDVYKAFTDTMLINKDIYVKNSISKAFKTGLRENVFNEDTDFTPFLRGDKTVDDFKEFFTNTVKSMTEIKNSLNTRSKKLLDIQDDIDHILSKDKKLQDFYKENVRDLSKYNAVKYDKVTNYDKAEIERLEKINKKYTRMIDDSNISKEDFEKLANLRNDRDALISDTNLNLKKINNVIKDIDNAQKINESGLNFLSNIAKQGLGRYYVKEIDPVSSRMTGFKLFDTESEANAYKKKISRGSKNIVELYNIRDADGKTTETYRSDMIEALSNDIGDIEITKLIAQNNDTMARNTSNNYAEEVIKKEINRLARTNPAYAEELKNLYIYSNKQEPALLSKVRGVVSVGTLGMNLATSLTNIFSMLLTTGSKIYSNGGNIDDVIKAFARIGKQSTKAMFKKDYYTGNLKNGTVIKDVLSDFSSLPQAQREAIERAINISDKQGILTQGVDYNLQSLNKKINDGVASKTVKAVAKAAMVPYALSENIVRKVTATNAIHLALKDPNVVKNGVINEEALVKYIKDFMYSTQGNYNKTARPAWARTQITGMLYQFKQYPQAYYEMMIYNAIKTFSGDQKVKHAKALGLQLLMMVAFGGATGIPLFEEVADLIDWGYGYFGDVSSQSKTKEMKEAFKEVVGNEQLFDFILNGSFGEKNLAVSNFGEKFKVTNALPFLPAFLQLTSPVAQKKASDVLSNMFGATSGIMMDSIKTMQVLFNGKDWKDKLNSVNYVVPGAMLKRLLQGGTAAYSNTLKNKDGRNAVQMTSGEGILHAIGIKSNDVVYLQKELNDIREDKLYVDHAKTYFKNKMISALANGDYEAFSTIREEMAMYNEDQEKSKNRVDFLQVKKNANASIKEKNKTAEERIKEAKK